MRIVLLVLCATLIVSQASATVVVQDPTMDQGTNDWHGDLLRLEFRDAPTTLNVLLRNNGLVFDPDPSPSVGQYSSVFLFDVVDGNGSRYAFRIEAEDTTFKLLRDGEDISQRIQFSGTPQAYSYQMLLGTGGLLGDRDLHAGDRIVDSVAWLNGTSPMGTTADRAPDTGRGDMHTFGGEGDTLTAFSTTGATAPGAAWWRDRWAIAFMPSNQGSETHEPGVYVVLQSGDGYVEHRVFSTGSAGYNSKELGLYADADLHLLVDPAGDGDFKHAWFNGTEWSTEPLGIAGLGSQVYVTPWLAGDGERLVAMVQTDDDRLNVMERRNGTWTSIHMIDAQMGHLAVNGDGAHIVWLDEENASIRVSQEHRGWNVTTVATGIDIRWFNDRNAVDDGGFAIAASMDGRVGVMWEDNNVHLGWVANGSATDLDTGVAGDGGNPVTRLRMALDGHGNVHASGGYYGLNFVAVGTPNGAWERHDIDGRDLHAMAVAPDGRRIVTALVTSSLTAYVVDPSPFGDLPQPMTPEPSPDEGCPSGDCPDPPALAGSGKNSPTLAPLLGVLVALAWVAKRR